MGGNGNDVKIGGTDGGATRADAAAVFVELPSISRGEANEACRVFHEMVGERERVCVCPQLQILHVVESHHQDCPALDALVVAVVAVPEQARIVS